MTGDRRRRLRLAGAAILAVALVVAGVATILTSPGRTASSPETCSPAPCAAPQGMELHVDQMTVVGHGTGRRLVLTIHFANHTEGQAGEATSSRHTGLADFVLHEAGGPRDRPVFGDGCPKWPDVTLARGQASDERTVCFDLGGQPGEAARLEWSPDLGLFFRSVIIDLGRLPG